MPSTLTPDELTTALSDVNETLTRIVETNKPLAGDLARPRLAARRAWKLVSSLIEQLDRLDDPIVWSADRNDRRCELIDKRIAGSITEAESVELLRLQAAASAFRNQEAPLPVANAKQLHAELLSRQASRRQCAEG